MTLQRVAWGLLAVVILIIMFAPLAAYCMMDDNDDEASAGPGASIRQASPLIDRDAPIVVASGDVQR